MSDWGGDLHLGGYVIRGSRRCSVPDDTGGHSGNGTGRHNWGATGTRAAIWSGGSMDGAGWSW